MALRRAAPRSLGTICTRPSDIVSRNQCCTPHPEQKWYVYTESSSMHRVRASLRPVAVWNRTRTCADVRRSGGGPVLWCLPERVCGGIWETAHAAWVRGLAGSRWVWGGGVAPAVEWGILTTRATISVCSKVRGVERLSTP